LGKQSKKNTFYYIVRSTATPGTFAVNYCKMDSSAIPVQEDIVMGDDYKQFDKVIPTIEKYLRELQTKDKSSKFEKFPSIAESIFNQSGGSNYTVTLSV